MFAPFAWGLLLTVVNYLVEMHSEYKHVYCAITLSSVLLARDELLFAYLDFNDVLRLTTRVMLAMCVLQLIKYRSPGACLLFDDRN